MPDRANDTALSLSLSLALDLADRPSGPERRMHRTLRRCPTRGNAVAVAVRERGMPRESLALFGGATAWDPADWTDSDDRVRGGRSQVCTLLFQHSHGLQGSLLGWMRGCVCVAGSLG